MEYIQTDRNIWFTSDLHFDHDNCIKFCDRPTTPDEHNQWIINRLNSYIKPEDEVYCLGDVSFGNFNTTLECINKLNGKWTFIGGNHDNHERFLNIIKKTNHLYYGIPGGRVILNKKIQYHSQAKAKFFVLTHFPIESWENRGHGSIHCHGHVHNSIAEAPKVKNRFNVCFDLDFRPFHISEILNDNMGEFKNASTKIGH
jgi:calcineurin-like phosphoesterase family protein